MSKLNRQRGSAYQRYIAKRFDGENVGILGKQDVTNDQFSIECKERQAFAGQAFMDQCVRNCPRNKDGKFKRIPLVMIHILGKNHDEDLCMIRLKDFEDILNGK